MKKLLLCLLFFAGLAVIPAAAWEPNDLTKYPSIMNENNWIFNFGIGLPHIEDLFYSDDDITHVWPFCLTLDRNLSIGEKKLPFFLGGHIGYSGIGYLNRGFENRIILGARFGYHFNWGIENLDTYAVTTAGWIFLTGNDYYRNNYSEARKGIIHVGVKIGARWFVYDFFGFWAEAGYTTSSILDAGITFKF